MTDKTFLNPYPETKDGPKQCYLQSRIAEADYQLIQCCRPGSGTIRTTVNLLWQKLATKLRELGYDNITSKSDFESFVANCIISDGRANQRRNNAGKSPRRLQAKHEGADGGGATRVHPVSPEQPSQPSDVSSHPTQSSDEGTSQA